MFATLKYMFQVKGHGTIPSNSFPARMGCTNSDMFRIASGNDSVTLEQYHMAFLSSPVFQTELKMLRLFGFMNDTSPTDMLQLRDVARGDLSGLGPWTSWAVTGRRIAPVTCAKETACVVMSCTISGKPFCDTWWAVENLTGNRTELVFGTAMIQKDSYSSKPSLWVRLMTPFHRLYSRLLLASARANLDHMKQKRN